MCLPFQFELPDSFIHRYRPVRVHRDQNGLSGYLLDGLGLDFYRTFTTAQQVPPDAIWSVMVDPALNSLVLAAGWCRDAIGYVLTDVPYEPPARSVWLLPRRLTYRQKLRLAILRGLLAELRQAPFAVPSEVVEFIETRALPGA